MSDVVIKVEGASKKYCRTIKHTMLYGATDLTRSFFGLNHHGEELRNGEFWAVSNVSFQLKRGQCLGIIGPNGSGKSTILKMLNGIFMPDKGRIEINGRVGALIEVGAGFHPLLTGRENIYVNGSILGMMKSEIDKKFNEIVEFAGIGNFIDSPVKHYSSGMHVRLGFAIAVHCDPDILLVDEVLAVGDANFRNKCFKKFLEFKSAGTSVIMVTHDMEPIVRYCDQAILLQHGIATLTGKPSEITSQYVSTIRPRNNKEHPPDEDKKTVISSFEIFESGDKKTMLEEFIQQVPLKDSCVLRKNYNSKEHSWGDKRGEIVDFLLLSNDFYYPETVNSNDWIDIYMKVKFNEAVEYPVYGLKLRTIDGLVIYATKSTFKNVIIRPTKKSEIVVLKFSLKLSVAAGEYFISLAIADGQFGTEDIPLDRRYDLIHLNVQNVDLFDGMVDLECYIKECS
ncbi:MAG: ABC transporter ATP-binding protein [Candidatus Scalindua sp.]|nr:ABC transporter ATP-binding protein [Candidatus Scalindua sp.]